MLAVSMTTSTFVANLAWVLLAANWVVEWNWKEKFADFKENRLLHLCLLFFLLHCIGLLYSSNLEYGLNDIRKKLPLLVVPLVVLTSNPLSRKELWCVFGCYATTIFVVSIIGLVRYLTIPDLPYREIVPFISHIRFALNVCFVFCLFAYFLMQKTPFSIGCFKSTNLIETDQTCDGNGRKISKSTIIISALMLWLLGFLLLLRSYTAFFVLFLLPILFLCWKKAWLSWKGAAYLGVVVLMMLLVGGYARDYFGNCDRSGGVIENGSYIESDVSELSLRSHWNEVSKMSIDDPTPNGYSVYPTLVRYLNSCGYPKDSSGIAMLSAEDVRNIENGMANVVYANRLSLRSMCYVIFYELECYWVSGSLGESSFLHRVELWRNGWMVFLEHPFFGVGTGDAVDVSHARLDATDSQLAGTGKHTHNQYLSLLLAFGIVGCGLLLFFFVRALCSHSFGFLFVLSLTIVLLSCLSEDTFETLAGCLFACIPCLFYHRNSE